MIKPAILAAALILAPAPALAASLITNGGFEAGNLSGWTQFGNTGFTSVNSNQAGFDPAGGSYLAYFGPVDSTGGITQSFASVVGKTYRLTFEVAADAGGTVFDAAIGGVSQLTLGSSFPGWTLYSFTHTATSTSTDVAFTTQHNPSYFVLDNVAVFGPVPEPQAWAMLIVGFGLVGAAARRRRAVIAA